MKTALNRNAVADQKNISVDFKKQDLQQYGAKKDEKRQK